MHPINFFGTEEQKMKFLPGLATGELIGAFGLTEPNHASDPSSMETKAKRSADGSEYVVSADSSADPRADLRPDGASNHLRSTYSRTEHSTLCTSHGRANDGSNDPANTSHLQLHSHLVRGRAQRDSRHQRNKRDGAGRRGCGHLRLQCLRRVF